MTKQDGWSVRAPQRNGVQIRSNGNPRSSFPDNSISTFHLLNSFTLPSCEVCGLHEATVEITVGINDNPLRLCQFCHRDFVMQGALINQTIALKTSADNVELPDRLILGVLQ